MSELGPEDEALLEAARGGLEPTATDRARNKRALFAQLGLGVGAGATATATATSTASAATSAAATTGAATTGVATTGVATTGAAVGSAVAGSVGVGSILVKAIVVLSLVGGVATGGVVLTRRARPPAINSPAAIVEPRAIDAVSAAIVEAPSPPPRVTPFREPSPPIEQPSRETAIVVDRTEHPPLAHRAAPTAIAPTRASTPAPALALDGETSLLREADGRLRAGDGAGALALLDQHEARFPNAILGEEREGERVLALCSLGRVAEARARAARFLASSPRSPVAPRVKSSCAGDSKPR
jgi:hypothetical protein